MRAMPLTIGNIHFVGIGGIGMSGIAEILHNLGYTVRGSDVVENPNVRRLRTLGIPITVGHSAENLGDAQVVVVSSAIQSGNAEVESANANLIPVVQRAEMLAELMRLSWSIAVGGTHGKTTTTSLVAALLDAAGFDPTVINGGIINAYGTNARLGEGEWLVAEADESDGTFVKLPATIAIVTNIDPEHLEFYGSFDELKNAFYTFVQSIPFYGFAAVCLDHPEVRALIGRVTDRRLITYGFSPQAEVRADNLVAGPGDMRFDVTIGVRGEPVRSLSGLSLPMFGQHNVQNALAAIAVANEMNIDDKTIERALASFAGVKRRFTKTGEAYGVTIIDDYGHHPVEIAAVLKAARTATRHKVVAVVQPHRFTRLQTLFEDFCLCFNDADHVIVADIYAAGEDPIEGVDRDALALGVRTRGHRNVHTLDDPANLAELLAQLTESGDLVVCLGAGTITKWANALPAELAALGISQAGSG
jgi:UDP-N-acetylmuramate--alanine ligase